MFTLVSAGFAPALALMAFFYLKDQFDSEPITSIIKTFLYGALLVFPIMFIQYAFAEEGIGQNPWVLSFILTASLEEFFKWFIFLYAVYKYPEFDSIYDGIIYGASISLGFATVENILYLLAHGIEYAFSRALFPVSSHALFGVIMGYYVGRAKFKASSPKFMLLLSLMIPLLLHGIYDVILQTVKNNWIYLLIPFMITLWVIGLRKVKLANAVRTPNLLLQSDKDI